MPRATVCLFLLASLLAGALASASHPLPAQGPPLILPKQSPRAFVSQTVGLTTISVTYDRPSINGRAIWGQLVPFDSVWRAGANENTVIAFSSSVTVGGRAVPAGRYGLHMIPGRENWTIILSRQASAWGSFSYDPTEDLVRFTTTPTPSPMQERLAYSFDEPTDSTVVATLRWERLAVPIRIDVASRTVVTDSLREQLRGLGRFSWQTWSAAAAWSAANNTNLVEATAWADRSIQMASNFTNLQVKASLLALRGDREGAAVAVRRSLEVATEVEVNDYGYALISQRKVDSAIVIFRRNVVAFPQSWNTYDSLGEALALQGNKTEAIANYSRALALVQDESQRRRIQALLAGLRG